MSKINVMVNGLPGNMGKIISSSIAQDDRFQLVDASLTGPGILDKSVEVEGISVNLALPEDHESALKAALDKYGSYIIVDYSHPSAVNPNAELYCKVGIPFVMGTTGGDRAALIQTVENSGIAAVIAPNMAKQIVGFQAMMEYAANTFPGLFEGYSLTLEESHQQGKADTSGTAKAMVSYFNQMGVPFETDQIVQIRDPEQQKNDLGVPEEYLGGHGWHTYTLVSPDKTVKFSFTHNVNGRDIYRGGTADAVVYLNNKVGGGAKGRVFSMIEVMQGV
ncbi:dihydrodipicolinate reductase [Desulfatibacillum aliphaticivorans]|uniref:4-hydroxy-tetrahydrodipicolinate reductase n=1 Tax=Desulfatibacillum aliphaticivorans TaxID=218208 RepID=B8FI97_DESAL|nr:dihydrodipicolinate reductase [Desulfatibacillum aliphaticivorans]ACL02664.1 dihydrodipicolinate reductase [Desulfatibacillum aliphaticivorans]